jgi:polyhydroxybutyrate depolymerase
MGAAGQATAPTAGTSASAAAGGTGVAGSAGTSAAASGAPASPAAGAGSAGSGGATAASGGIRSTGPGDWTAGDYPPDLTTANYLEITGLENQGGMPRQYRVHVPASYKPEVPAPVVFCFHGLGQEGVMFCLTGTDLVAKSDEAGFILVMPNGYANSWNGGTCCGDAASQKLDEVGFVHAMFDEISKHLNLDLGRVYATGLSNGGYMSYRMACEAADLFVAVAPAAGAIGSSEIGGGTATASDITTCMAKGVSVLDIHGTQDALIPYSTQKPSLERVAMENGCMLTTKPATQPESKGDVTCVSYEGCPMGIDITGCSVMGGGHVWFGSPNCGTGADGACAIVGANSENINNTDAIWEFFSAHSRP